MGVVGGPGAVFWMWMTAIVGIATKFFTCSLAVMYRGRDSQGQLLGGPMYVITEGLGPRYKPLATMFCLAGVIGCLPLVQINQLVQTVREVVFIDQGWLEPANSMPFNFVAGLILATIVALVIFGGLTRIALVAGKLVPTMALLLDTRKTIPGLRLAQKYAGKIGGGQNHRVGLFDAFLIKENHIKAAGGISNAIKKARKVNNSARIEIEVETIDELKDALEHKPDWILLDNFSISDMVRAVKITKQKAKLEASGGISDADNLLEIAKTGVDFISMGELTKNIKAVDLSLLLD